MKPITLIITLFTITTYSSLYCWCRPHETYGEIRYNGYNVTTNELNAPQFLMREDIGNGQIVEWFAPLNVVLECGEIDLVKKLLDAGERDDNQWHYNYAMQTAKAYLEIAKTIKEFEEQHANTKPGPAGISYEEYLRLKDKETTTPGQDPLND